MIKLAGVASVLLFTSVAMAGTSGPYTAVVKSSTMAGNAFETKAAALESGRMMIVDVNRMDSVELSRNVFWSTNDQVDINSFELLNSQVEIEEIVTSEGAIAYQPVISVSYEYRSKDRD